MDFSSLNPNTSTPLNIAARKNDFQNVHRLLKKMNPNCVDNRGWTCLHEAAANDSLQSLKLILKHPDCRPLAETHEGHTSLYLACRNHCSTQTIKALLNSAEDIANYGSTEGVTPLHVASTQGRVEVIQLLIDHGAMIDVQDFDGDTPLHDAALGGKCDSVVTLLHAGADAGIRNESECTPLHLASFKGGFKVIQFLLPFIDDINRTTVKGDTALMLATQGDNEDIVSFLLENGADPHIKNTDGQMALDIALFLGHDKLFNLLLNVADKDKINKDCILIACKPHYFKLRILDGLLNHGLGPEFFHFNEMFHVTMEKIGDIQPVYEYNAPLNSFLNICEYIYNTEIESFSKFFYLFLMSGVSVNAVRAEECPPLVYIHYSGHNSCFKDVFKILIEHNCNVDYSSIVSDVSKERCLPDAFIASLTSDPSTISVMLPYSLHCEPDQLLSFTLETGVLSRMPLQVESFHLEVDSVAMKMEKGSWPLYFNASTHYAVIKRLLQKQLLGTIDSSMEEIEVEALPFHVLPLKHLCRLQIRSCLRQSGVKTTEKFLQVVDRLPLPPLLKNYVRYL